MAVNLRITIKNPPAGAELWKAVLCDANKTIGIYHTDPREYIGIGETALYEVPSGIAYPLLVVELAVVKWNASLQSYDILYFTQSFNPGGMGYNPNATIPGLAGFYYNVATEKFELIQEIAGEILAALVKWPGQPDWQQVLADNTWPANTALTFSINVKNTGSKSATFRVTFMGGTSGQLWLNPGESSWVYLYATSPAPGSYTYDMVLLGDSQTLQTLKIRVNTSGVIPEVPEFRNLVVSYRKGG